MNLNVTCVMQGMWVIRVVTYTSAYKSTLESHLQLTNICNLQHNSEMPERFIEQFTPSRNLAANLIVSIKKCYTFTSVNQH